MAKAATRDADSGLVPYLVLTFRPGHFPGLTVPKDIDILAWVELLDRLLVDSQAEALLQRSRLGPVG